MDSVGSIVVLSSMFDVGRPRLGGRASTMRCLQRAHRDDQVDRPRLGGRASIGGDLDPPGLSRSVRPVLRMIRDRRPEISGIRAGSPKTDRPDWAGRAGGVG
ncbi:MAG: hypothetical protein BGO49_30040 [Planctomycetales bacterium 71-10]|nr:MAG: hypothetical protein BGO49_30040 [Planctomycetales bacterium 71-10]